MMFNFKQTYFSHRRFLGSRPVVSLACALALTAGVSSLPSAQATDLSPSVLAYIQRLNPDVEIRFDGLITFSNGESYLPILPQDLAAPTIAKTVVKTIPENAKYPDFIQFDNNLFLIRLVRTASGKLTFPRMAAYPIELKEGLLPQDLVLPGNLYIPAELKVILGSLPYHPQATTDDPVLPDAVNLNNATPQTVSDNSTAEGAVPPTLYLAQANDQLVVALEPTKAVERGKIELGCLPSSMTPAPNDQLLYVTCLSSNDLVVVDTHANLVKTRVAVGEKPGSSVFINNTPTLIVGNRYSKFLSLVNTTELVTNGQIPIPGYAGPMVTDPRSGLLYVADSLAGQIYKVDAKAGKVLATLTALPNISSLWIPEGSNQLWFSSRSANQVQALNLLTGALVKTWDVGKKPIALAGTGDLVYSLSAVENRLDIINWKTQELTSTIPLKDGCFPSSIVLSPDGSKAYINGASSQELYVIDLKRNWIEKTFGLPIQGFTLTYVGGVKPKTDTVSVEQEPAIVLPEQKETPPPANDLKSKLTGLFHKREAEPVPSNNNVIPEPASSKPSETIPVESNETSTPTPKQSKSKRTGLFHKKEVQPASTNNATPEPVVPKSPEIPLENQTEPAPQSAK